MRDREGVTGFGSEPVRSARWVRAGTVNIAVSPVAPTEPNRAEHHQAVSPSRAQTLPPPDPRWTLAVKTAQMLQGSVLPAHVRSDLVRIGESLGLRPFEANLIIALMQDQARTGGTLYQAGLLVNLMPQAAPPRRRASLTVTLSVLAALAAEILLVWKFLVNR